jgi:hypothetical protein
MGPRAGLGAVKKIKYLALPAIEYLLGNAGFRRNMVK